LNLRHFVIRIIFLKHADIGLSQGGCSFDLENNINKTKLSEMENITTQDYLESKQQTVISPADLLTHWQGHRSLTRRVITAFPEDKLFTYDIGGMRPFSVMVMEMIGLAAPGVRGAATGNWTSTVEISHQANPYPAITKNEMLRLWDEVTNEINTTWPAIPVERFQETDLAFGQYEGTVYSTILYLIDNEIHHRGQGYVYLRALGIEPPPFWDR
jgi:uncharacterized damage-inducible protein DinB